MPNSFTNTTIGSEPNRGSRNTAAATPLTLADLQNMDLEDLARMQLSELEGSDHIFRNGFNMKQPQTVSRS